MDQNHPRDQFKGLITAVTTPFDKHNKLDTGAFAEHLQFLWEHGINHVLIAGTTGEFFSLTASEKRRILTVAKSVYRGNIMFHAGASCLADTIELAQFAENNGADSVAALLPFYLANPEQDGIVGYLNAISSGISIPFIIYNFPKHTQCAVNGAILDKIPHFAIKDSSADLSLIEHTPRYFIGSDKKLLESHKQGGAGFISARANCEPNIYAQMHDALITENTGLASKLHTKILEITNTYSGKRQISQIKQAIAKKLPGYPSFVRLPLL